MFDSYKPDAPVLAVDSGRYFITLGEVKMPAVFLLGGTGDWSERYGVRIPATDSPTGKILRIVVTYKEKDPLGV